MIINTDRALLDYVAGRYEEAERQCRAVLEMSPHFGVALFVLGLVHERQGRHVESIERLEEALRVSGAVSVMLGALGHAYGSADRKSEALQTIEELRRHSKERYVSPYSIATVHAGLGDRERALEGLERAVDERSVWLVHLHMAVDPRLEPLRSDSRFAGLLSRMSLS
jgi:tetratricopeptide (TPR) repeat protein